MLNRYHMQDNKPLDTFVDKIFSLSCDVSQDFRRKWNFFQSNLMPMLFVVWCMQWCVHVSIYVMSLDWLVDINKTLVKNSRWQSKESYEGLHWLNNE